MLIYIIIFFFSCLFFWLGGHAPNKWNIYSIIGILIPCFMAALRGDEVGTDTSTYHWMYDQCVLLGSWEIASLRVSAEPSFYFISIIGSHLTGFSTLSFIYQFITIFFVYLTAYKYRRYIDVWVAIFLYFCFIYTLSFNIVRQCAAVSLLLYGTSFLGTKNKLFWVYTLIGTFFHTSCLIASIFIYTLYYILFRVKKWRKVSIALYTFGLILLLALFLKIVSLLGYVGIGRMEDYSNDYGISRSSYVSITELIYRFIFAVMILIASYYGVINKKLRTPYFMLLLTEVSLMLLGIYNGFLVRLAVYFTIIQLLIIPVIVKSSKLTISSRVLSKSILVLLSFTYWWWTIVHNGTNAVIPYYIE